MYYKTSCGIVCEVLNSLLVQFRGSRMLCRVSLLDSQGTRLHALYATPVSFCTIQYLITYNFMLDVKKVNSFSNIKPSELHRKRKLQYLTSILRQKGKLQEKHRYKICGKFHCSVTTQRQNVDPTAQKLKPKTNNECTWEKTTATSQKILLYTGRVLHVSVVSQLVFESKIRLFERKRRRRKTCLNAILDEFVYPSLRERGN